MQEIALALVIGIVSSLLATAVFISIAEFFRRVVLPWYADKIYRGVRIDGDWEEESVDEITDGTLSMAMSLSQKGDVITGTYTHSSDGDTDVYVLTGKIRDQYLLATAVPKSNRHVDGASFLLRILNEGGKLTLRGGLLHQTDDAQKDFVGAHIGVNFTWINEVATRRQKGKRKKTSEQGGAGQPATRPESR